MPATRRSVQVLSPAVRLVLGYLARGWQIWFNVCSQSCSVSVLLWVTLLLSTSEKVRQVKYCQHMMQISRFLIFSSIPTRVLWFKEGLRRSSLLECRGAALSDLLLLSLLSCF